MKQHHLNLNFLLGIHVYIYAYSSERILIIFMQK